MSVSFHRQFARLAARWRRREALSAGLHGLVLGLPLAALTSLALRDVAATPTWGAICLLVALVPTVLALTQGIVKSRRIGPQEIARHLDRVAPALQDSSALLLIEEAELPMLGRLQRARVARALKALESSATLPSTQVWSAFRWAAVALGVAAGIALLPTGDLADVTSPLRDAGVARDTALQSPTDLIGAVDIDVHVEPLAYTQRPPRSTSGLDLRAEEGATIRWQVRLETSNAEHPEVELVFDETQRMQLDQNANGVFEGKRVAESSRIYALQVRSGNRELYRSPFARLEVVPDEAPTLRVIEPEPRITLNPSGALQLAVRVDADDDYGLSQAALVATLATGTGEMVQFRERRLPVAVRRNQAGEQSLTTGLDLAALGMQPGSDLYFHLEVQDNREPERNAARTPAWMARLPGDNEPSIAMSRGLPIVRLPEYFRSQRQIIIDTEKLIAESTVVTRSEFRRRAQEIGMDQRALRLRYGTILGEQFESGVPAEDEGHEDEEHSEPEEGSTLEDDAAAEDEGEDPTEGYVHVHDSVENATFFTTSIKQELRAALAAMWSAEGKLRTFAVDDALPSEYTALKHIKNVQQGARVYVLKVGFDPPPVDVAAKRLTGDLSKIDNQREQRETQARIAAPRIRRALDVLESIGTPAAPGAESDASARVEAAAALADATTILAQRARDRGADNLEALNALRRVRDAWSAGDAANANDLDQVARELWQALPQPGPRPQPATRALGTLHDAYLQQLTEAR